MFNTPILFLIYNRPKITNLVFDKIREIKPKQLFIAADGPLLSKPNEKYLCEQSRAIVKKIDWDCEVKTLFRENNLGCGKAVSSAISWFFESVEEGIILEDDCLPQNSFFHFCSVMLEKYRYETTVWQIAGTNFLFGERPSKYDADYFFSAHSAIWGWATWKRVWQNFSLDISNGRSHISNVLEKRIANLEMRNWLLNMYEAIENKRIDTWDVQWNYHFHCQNGLCITPISNLIQNIGILGSHFTHRTAFHYMPIKKISTMDISNLKTITPIQIQYEIDVIAFNNILNRKLPLAIRILEKIKKIIK